MADGTARLEGVMAPVLTPFGADLEPDAARLARHGRWLLGQGVSALAVFGTTSEANSLSADERERVLEALLADGIEPGRLLPGTGCCALTDTVRLTRHAVARGCAGVLALPPFYYKAVTDDGLYRSFAEVIERVGDRRLRLVLYHIPPVAQVGLSLRLVERLVAAYPGVVAGIKDSSGDLATLEALLGAFGGTGFSVFAGSERLLLRTLRGGGAGCITASANVNPGPIARLFREWRAPQAEAWQAELDAVRSALESRPVIPALKAILAARTGDEGWRVVRPPLLPLDEGRAAQLMAELDALGFATPGLAAALAG
jgi:4-hydroxy-tetrahydrodipicolinate synthase